MTELVYCGAGSKEGGGKEVGAEQPLHSTEWRFETSPQARGVQFSLR